MGQIVIVATLDVKPEHKVELVNFLKNDLVEQSRAEEGNSQYDLHEILEEENKLVFVELWASEEAIEKHNASTHFQKFVQFIDGKLNALDIKKLEKIA